MTEEYKRMMAAYEAEKAKKAQADAAVAEAAKMKEMMEMLAKQAAGLKAALEQVEATTKQQGNKLAETVRETTINTIKTNNLANDAAAIKKNVTVVQADVAANKQAVSDLTDKTFHDQAVFELTTLNTIGLIKNDLAKVQNDTLTNTYEFNNVYGAINKLQNPNETFTQAENNTSLVEETTSPANATDVQ